MKHCMLILLSCFCSLPLYAEEITLSTIVATVVPQEIASNSHQATNAEAEHTTKTPCTENGQATFYRLTLGGFSRQLQQDDVAIEIKGRPYGVEMTSKRILHNWSFNDSTRASQEGPAKIFCLVSIGVKSNCKNDATWLAWSEWTTCSDACGSCGVHMRTRTCLTTTTECVCPGSSTTIEYCNLEICRYPRLTCCYNLKVTSYNGRFACLENSTYIAPSVD